MTRMADPERRRGELDDDEARFEDDGRRSIFSALWFRTSLVVIVFGVVAAVAVPYVLEFANQPPPKPTIVARPEPLAPPPAPAPPPASPATTPAPSPAAEKPPVVEKPPVAEKPAQTPMSASEKPAAAKKAGGGVVVKPRLPLRDAVALSKDLAVDGLKVQVRRAGASAPAPSAGAATSGGDSLYRIRVGPFDDRVAATSTLRELEQRGYTPFIARGGQ